MTGFSNYAICYEATQRIYRNCVIKHVRSISDAHTWDMDTELPDLFRKEWSKLKESADERRLTGEIGSELKDALDYLGINHFQNLFESKFDQLFPEGPGITSGTRQQERQAVLRWAKEIKVLRDPTSHPSDDDLPYADAVRAIDSARRILLKIDKDAANQVDELLSRLNGAPNDFSNPESPSLEGFLPSRESIALRFVGRRNELSALQTWLGDEASRMWALTGAGGKGKTAIAYQFACEIKETAP